MASPPSVLNVLGAAVLLLGYASAFSSLPNGKEKVVFIHDGVLDDFLGEVLLMNAAKSGQIDFLGTLVINADSVLPSSVELVYKMRCAMGVDPAAVPVGLSQARLFNAFPWDYRRDSYSMWLLPEMQSIECDIPSVFNDGDAWLEATLEAADDGSITLLQVTALTNIAELFVAKPHLQKKVKKMVWMAGAIDVPGNLEERHFIGFPKCTAAMEWGCAEGESFPEWNVFGDPYSVDTIFEKTTFPIFMVPLDLADQLPIPGEFMEAMAAANSSSCNQAVYGALYKAYDTFAAPQPFYRLWDSAAVMYELFGEAFGAPETSPIGVGTSWDYLGLLVRQSEVDAGQPALASLAQTGSPYDPPAFREVNMLLTLAENGASRIFEFAAQGACAAGTGP
eukprot:6191339-Pleurochrysis_carterae.AAC.2